MEETSKEILEMKRSSQFLLCACPCACRTTIGKTFQCIQQLIFTSNRQFDTVLELHSNYYQHISVIPVTEAPWAKVPRESSANTLSLRLGGVLLDGRLVSACGRPGSERPDPPTDPFPFSSFGARGGYFGRKNRTSHLLLSNCSETC